tara:strand:- start:2450 stop:2851 length:402 start_codon:yes stop_codon:yes gene_type:complete
MIAKNNSTQHGKTYYYYWFEDCMCGPYETIQIATDKFLSAIQCATEYNEPHLLRKALISASIYYDYINKTEAENKDNWAIIERQTNTIDTLENEVLSLREQLDEMETEAIEWKECYHETKAKIDELKNKYMEN